MSRKIMLVGCIAIFSLALHASARAQTEDRKIEVGGQFSLLDATNGRASITTILPCGPGPCTPIPNIINTDGRAVEPGFGGRIGYGVSRYFTLEAEGNFFPRERNVTDDNFNGGRKLQGLFGVKIGRRYDKVGLFAKARPGFVRFSQGDFTSNGNPCVASASFPTPIACLAPRARTDFAFDLGGVLELYPSAHAIIRFDAGDTILRTGAHIVPVHTTSNGTLGLGLGSDTTHNFQGSIGVGYRF